MFMKNPFLSREPVYNSAEFIGRFATTAKWNHEQPENYNFIGLPRSGKTSLLYHLCYAHPAPHLAVWVPLVQLPSYSSLTLWQLMFEQFQAAQKTADLSPAAPPNEKTADDYFEALRAGITRLQKKSSRPITFFIDDFDLLLGGVTGSDLDWMRSLITNRALQVTYVIASIRPLVSLVDEIGASYSPLYNAFSASWIGLLSREEAETLCQQTAVFAQLPPWNTDELNFLLNEAGRHPALLKIACQYLLATRSCPETQRDFRTDVQVQALCKRLFDYCTPAEQQTLGQIATCKPITNRPTANQLRSYALVEEQNEQLALFAGVFHEWVCQKLGITQPETAVSPSPSSSLFNHLPEQRIVFVHWQSAPIPLTQMENRLLAYLWQHANTICTAEDLLNHVWGEHKKAAVVEKTINRLRAKIEEDAKRPRYILSARGEGYLLRV